MSQQNLSAGIAKIIQINTLKAFLNQSLEASQSVDDKENYDDLNL